MYSSRMQNSMIRYLIIFFDTAPIVVLHTPVATNRLTAIGGVIIPIEVFTIMIRPSAIGLTPSAVAIGSRIGVTRRMMDCVSRKHPRNRSSRFITNRMTNLLVKIDMIVVDRIVGMFSVVMNQPNGADMDTTNSTTAELTQESAKILYSVFRFTSLNTNTEMISA